MAVRRGITLVLAFIGLIVLAVAGILAVYLVAASRPSVPERATLLLRPRGELPETRPDDLVAQVTGRDAPSLRGYIESLQKAKRDPRITSVLLRPSTLDTPFWGRVQELRDAIMDFRRSGKRVVAYLEYGGGREYYLASVADQIFLLPTSPLDLTGVASYEIFLRGALDKLGAYPDFVQIGPYKTAANQLTQRGFTPAHREMTESLNRNLYDQLVRGIADARHKRVEEVQALLDEGPFTPDAARRAGLVDDLAYFDQLDDRVPALRTADGDMPLVEESEYERVDARSVGIRPRSRIAVLYASGVIVSGKSRYDAVNGRAAGSETLVDQIQQIREDESIKAIVLRVDSPGGSSVASDVIWRELMITRDGAVSRPVVASMSDLAASGGYYIAMPAHVIVAEPGTLTGSIGIFGGKVAIGGTMDKLGIETAAVQSGRNADMNSPFTPFTPEQRVRLMGYMKVFYDDFVRKAAVSRRTTPERIDAVAQGRVWTGQQAREKGLVDELGGLEKAVAIAKERAHIPANEDVELVTYPPRRTLYETLTAEFGSSSIGVWAQFLGGGDSRALAAFLTPSRLFRRGEPLAIMPYVFIN